MRQSEHVRDLVEERPDSAAPSERLAAARVRLTEECGILPRETPLGLLSVDLRRAGQ